MKQPLTKPLAIKVYPEDEDAWERLAKKWRVRLPRADASLTTAGLTRFIKRLGISVADWQRLTYEPHVSPPRRLSDFVKDNPGFTLKALAGCVLEEWDYIHA